MICVGGPFAGRSLQLRRDQVMINIPAPMPAYKRMFIDPGWRPIADDDFSLRIEEYRIKRHVLRWEGATLEAHALVHSSIKDRGEIQNAILAGFVGFVLSQMAIAGAEHALRRLEGT